MILYIPLTSALGQELLILERKSLYKTTLCFLYVQIAATYIKYTSIPYIFILSSPVFATTVNVDIKELQ